MQEPLNFGRRASDHDANEKSRTSFVKVLVVAVICLLGKGTAFGQDLSAPTFNPRGQTDILRHRDFAGKPCLTVSGTARPHIIDRTLYDHVIIASNVCPQHITIRVCYYRTENCIPMDISGGQRKEAILGTLPATKEFGFEFREKF
jgi:hypothetical protein